MADQFQFVISNSASNTNLITAQHNSYVLYHMHHSRSRSIYVLWLHSRVNKKTEGLMVTYAVCISCITWSWP